MMGAAAVATKLNPACAKLSPMLVGLAARIARHSSGCLVKRWRHRLLLKLLKVWTSDLADGCGFRH